LEIDFGAPIRFDTVITREHTDRRTTFSPGSAAAPGRILSYRIQVWDGAWHDVVRGTRIGVSRTDRFPPVLAPKVRLYLTSATDSPIIDEFEVYKTRATSAEREHKP
jgi:hypothetical protein